MRDGSQPEYVGRQRDGPIVIIGGVMVDSNPDGHNAAFCGEWEAIEELEDSEKRLAGGLDK